MAGNSQIDIIINGIDNFSKSINGAMDGIQKKAGGLGKGIASALGGTAAAGLGAFGIAAGGAVAAIGGIGLALGNMAKDAASIEGLRTAFYTLSEQAGTTGKDMLEAMKEGSGGTIAASDLMMQFNKASSLVNSQFATELPDAMGLVSKAAAATGQDMGFLMDSLVTGVGRVSPMILDNLGVQVSLTEATEAYAEANGLAASELTKTEQQMAVQEMVMGKLQEKYGDMDSVYDTTASKMQQLKAGFTDFKNELGEAFMPVLTQLMDTLLPIIKDLLYPMTGVVKALVPLFAGLMTALQPLINIFGEFAQGMGEILDAFLNEDPDRAIAAFSDEVANMADNLVDVLPGIIEFGTELIISLVKGIAASIPALMSAGLEIILAILDILIPMLPEMFNIGIDILLNLITGIANAIPELIPVGIKAILTLLTAVIKKLPDIIEAGVDILMSLIDGILNALPDLIAAVPEIIVTILNAIITNLPTILEAGIEILVALIEGIVGAIPQLTEAIPEVITALIDAIIALLPIIILAGVDILTALIKGIIDTIPVLLETLPKIWDALVGWFKEKDWGQIGRDIVGGIKDGLTGAWELIKTAFGTLLTDLPDWAKRLLGISSPSKVFMKIGREIPRGFAKGIEKNLHFPEVAMTKMAGIRSGIGSSSNTVNNYTLNMPSSNNPEDVIMAFELLEAYGGV